jgi:hypothetical protein
MNDSDSRVKMISLRLSQGDYDTLKSQYKTYGARNVSELARLALHRMMNGTASQSGDDIASKLAHLDDRVCALESEISLYLKREKVMS